MVMARLSRSALFRNLAVVVALMTCQLGIAQQDTGASKDWTAIGGGPGYSSMIFRSVILITGATKT